MNTFDDAKKVKWIVKEIDDKIRNPETFTVKFASLFLETDEDSEVYEEVKNFSVCSSFDDLVLIAIVIDCPVFRVKLLMQEQNDGFWMQIGKYENFENKEFEDDGVGSDTTKANWRKILATIYDYLVYEKFEPEEIYEKLLENFFKEN